jgi:hypothetical protein
MHETRSLPRTDPETAALRTEALAEIGIRARRYVQEPGDAAWYDLIDALRRTHGDSEAYELLRAVEIHSRTSRWR